MEDKRRHQRYNVTGSRSCELKYLDEPTIAGRIEDVSRSGVRIVSDTPLKELKESDFVMKSSWINRDIPVRLNIAWKDFISGKYHYGANFLSISPENVFELLDSLYEDWLEVAIKKN